MHSANEIDNPGSKSRKIWLYIVIVFCLFCGFCVIAFTIWWLALVKGDCGVVRIYEQIYAIFLCIVWLLSTTLGLYLTFHGFDKNSRSFKAGVIIAILVNLGVFFAVSKTVVTVRSHDFSLKSTPTLLILLDDDKMEMRQFAAHELGERRAHEAIHPLCEILIDASEYHNLRLNACKSLGQICSSDRAPSIDDLNSAIFSLVEVLDDKQEFVCGHAADALAAIASAFDESKSTCSITDKETIDGLAKLLGDDSKGHWTRVSALNALKIIDNDLARDALEQEDAYDPASSYGHIPKTHL